jgi:hypothetical protein
MNESPRAQLVFALDAAIDAARIALADNSIDCALAALEQVRRWSLAAGVPWAGEISLMIDELDPAMRTLRDIEARFLDLFPIDEGQTEES